MEDLGTELSRIQSNDESFCIECGCPITKENDSGWERFNSTGFITQKVCKTCDKKIFSGEKAKE
jgi:hypothetical protein